MNRRSGGALAVGVSREADPQDAAAEALRRIELAECAFVLAFAQNCAALEALDRAVGARAPVYGCVGGGQITPEGYESGALLALGFPRVHFRAAAALARPLAQTGLADAAEAARRAEEALERPSGWSCLGLLISDGASQKEDILAAALGVALEGVPVFGGSAGGEAGRGCVLAEGAVHADAALALLVATDLGWRGVGFDHFRPGPARIVVTGAEPEQRLLTEINGAPAAQEYARLVGVPLLDLDPGVFARNPLLARARDSSHVRAIQGVAANGALALLSPVDEGLVLTLGRSDDMLDAARAAFADLGRVDFVLGFDCVLRRLQIEQAGLTAPMSKILRDHRVLGFNTLGEQHHGMHVNQTFVGVAFQTPGGGT